MQNKDFFALDAENTDSRRIRKERDKARRLRKTHWWQQKLKEGLCYYCEQSYPSDQLTMDHRVPLARGGRSTKGNLVPACRECNENKKLETPAERILKYLS